MKPRLHRRIAVVLAVVIAIAGCAFGIRDRLDTLQGNFETDARIVHRLLSQRAAQHDAILATLALMPGQPGLDPALRRLPAVYPQIVRAEATASPRAWNVAAHDAAEDRSRTLRGPVLATSDGGSARFTLVQATGEGGIRVEIDVASMVPWSDWPLPRQTSPVRAVLVVGTHAIPIQPGVPTRALGTFEFRKRLASDSQPFDVWLTRPVVWADLPWLPLLAWIAGVVAVTVVALALDRQRERRRRAEELLRLGQVARLNTLGELAAGMAHELNQPLAALCAGTQAARRLIDEDPPDLGTAREAMAGAVDQARRAADVLARLRRLVERPGDPSRHQPVDLARTARDTLALLEPELERHGIRSSVAAPAAAPVTVTADPVGVEQVVHNLVMNAIQALADAPAERREVRLTVARSANQGMLAVADSGPGIAPDALPHLFEPFYTGRPGGLGLGLTLCETLAVGMNGRLTVRNENSGGAVFELWLPAVPAP